ncbi:MAG: ferritin [Bacteroidota bacterium]
MAEEWHAPYDHLSPQTITVHQSIRSLMEELEAVDWYRQRADDCADPQLKAVLLHNMREEIEHACMVLEWLRRNHPDFAAQMDTYLYSQGDITEVEDRAEAGGGRSDPTRT